MPRPAAAGPRPRSTALFRTGATRRTRFGPRAPVRGLGPVALGALCAVYAALAALPAVPGSELVLATAGGSPDWLLGPFRGLGIEAADGELAGPLFYAGLWAALLLYAVVLVRARELPARIVVASILALHLLFALAPPLLSQDVFSYIAYARLGVEHDLNPYAASPLAIFGDPVFGFAGSKSASSVYGPLFTLATYPLAPLGVPAGLWLIKGATALASLGVVAAVWRSASMRGRDPVLPALVVGANPLVLVHVVGGAHNEALMMLFTMLGVLAFLAGRESAGAALATVAAGVKASAGIVVPFLVAGSRRPLGVLGAAAATTVAIAACGLLAFGPDALDALGIIGANQERTSSLSIPNKLAELAALVGPGGAEDYRAAIRALLGAGFAVLTAALLLRTWRGGDPIAAAGWATVGLLLASAWLVPWYALWLLPLAALADDLRLLASAVVLCAWMLAIAVPL